jgi:regulator of nucleoside diphosphate kinase
MKYEQLIIESKEYYRIKEMIGSSNNKIDQTYRASVDKFLNELKDAKILNITEMPDDVVRFNSTVTIQDPYRNVRAYEIVKPELSNISQNKISVLAPMGLALFGYAKDDEIMWQFPSGLQAIKILKVQQATNLKQLCK